MKTKIFAAFPETGKTYACRIHNDKVKELNSKFYYFSDDHEILFDEKYMRDLTELLGLYEVILIDTNFQILNDLYRENIEFTIILPDENMLKEILVGHNEYESKSIINLWNRLDKISVINKVYLHKGESVNIYLEEMHLV